MPPREERDITAAGAQIGQILSAQYELKVRESPEDARLRRFKEYAFTGVAALLFLAFCAVAFHLMVLKPNPTDKDRDIAEKIITGIISGMVGFAFGKGGK